MSSRVDHAAGARASTLSGRPPERDDVDDAARFDSERHDLDGAGYRTTPKNAACSVRQSRATTLSLGRCRLWPDLPRPRMAGFEVSTEGLCLAAIGALTPDSRDDVRGPAHAASAARRERG